MKCILSFDDGPNSSYTAQLLDILGQYDAKAMFFVIGKHAMQHPELIKRIYAEGHTLGNHTYSHQRLVTLSTEELEKEIISTQTIMREIIHEAPRIFRPPYGEYDTRTQEICAKAGLEIMIWNIDGKDWETDDSNTIARRVIETARPGSIILLHELPQTVVALPNILESLHAKNLV